MSYELVPAVEAVMEKFPLEKKTGWDRLLEAGHILMDNTVGTVAGAINSVFQTAALMQGRYEIRRCVEYVYHMEEMKVQAEVEKKRLEVESEKILLQSNALHLYVDQQFQNSVNQILAQHYQQSRQIASVGYQAMQAIDKFAQSAMYCQNETAKKIIRENEAVYGAYADMINGLHKIGKTPAETAGDIVVVAMNQIGQLKDQQFNAVIDVVNKLLEPRFTSFDDYVNIRNSCQGRF